MYIEFVGALGVIAAFVVVGYIVRRFLYAYLKRASSSSANKIDDVLVIVLSVCNLWVYVIVGVYIGVSFFIDLPEKVSPILNILVISFLGFISLRLSFRLLDFAIGLYAERFGKGKKEIKALLPIVKIIGKLLLTALIAMFILSNLGVNVTTLIAGFGIGGLAFAFAFQKILADLFSTFVIFLDRPFTVGDSIELDGGASGVVEKIGLKTTSLRAFTGERITIANEDLASAVLHNNTDRHTRRVVDVIPVSYETKWDVLEKIPSIVEDLITSESGAEFGHIKLGTFGDYAIQFELTYFLSEKTYEEYMVAQHNINTKIVKEFAKRKIAFGYQKFGTVGRAKK